MKQLLQKLIQVQSQLKAPKNQRNNFGNYNYRSCEDILEAVKPICMANNSTIVLSDTVELIGNRFYIKATATFFDNETGNHIETSSYAREEETKKGMDASQITGAASSYARKYALNGLLQIDDNKDADTNTYQQVQQPQKPVQQQYQTPQAQSLQDIYKALTWISETTRLGCERLGIDPYKYAAYKKIPVEQLTDAMLIEAIRMRNGGRQ